MTDDVNHPEHYNVNGLEVIDVIETYAKHDFRLANVIKYVCRSAYKGKELEDLRKAEWYLKRAINDRADAAVEETMKDLVTRRLDRSRRVYRESRSGICRARERSSMDEPIEKPTTYDEAMTSPALCPFIEIEGYVHGVQCGCSVMVPTVTSWPPDDHDFSDGPGAAEAIKFQADHSPDYVTLPGATTPPETLVNTSSSSRVGGQVRIDAYDDYYGFNDDEVITKCGLPTCGKDIQAKDTYVTVGSKDFCGVPCLSTYRGVHGV